MGDRLFVAVLPPSSLVGSLSALVEPRRDADDAWRWAPSRQWHLTLAFMADAPTPLADDLGVALAEVAGRTSPFLVTAEGGGCFPHPDAARVLFLGVSGDTDALARLSRRCRTAAERLGIEVEGGRFRPHLTLARARRPEPARRWLTLVDSFPALPWPVTELVLMQSTLHRSGAEHRPLGVWSLGGEAGRWKRPGSLR